jgi:hypothetical protein
MCSFSCVMMSFRSLKKVNSSSMDWYDFCWPSCHPEVSMSMESIFGKDVDILPWNHGMTDGRNAGLYNLWTQRTGVHPTRSILFSFGQRFFNDIHNDYVNAV